MKTTINGERREITITLTEDEYQRFIESGLKGLVHAEKRIEYVSYPVYVHQDQDYTKPWPWRDPYWTAPWDKTYTITASGNAASASDGHSIGICANGTSAAASSN